MTTDPDPRIEYLNRQFSRTDRIAALEARVAKLREALKEMIEASAAMMRVINNAVEGKADIIDDLEDELRGANIADGFGVRARTALAETAEET